MNTTEELNAYGWKRIITEAGIISLIIIYSYAVYLMGEEGYLHAIGLNNATSLVTLDIQSVLLGFFKAAMYLMYTMLIFGIIIFPFARAKVKNKFPHLVSGMPIVLSSVVVGAGVGPIVYDSLGKIGLYTFLCMIIIISLCLLVKWPGRSKSINQSFSALIDKKLIGTRRVHPALNPAISLIVISLIAMPFINYIIGYDTLAMGSRDQVVKVANVDDKQYWIARMYSDKYVLLQIINNQATSSYMIAERETLKSISFVTKEIYINTEALHPKSHTMSKLSEVIKNFIMN